MLISILAFIILITILVFVHEMGHYIAARSVGIRVEKFYVGFNFFGLGWKKTYKGTEYGIGLFPLGGYVKVAGIIDESMDILFINALCISPIETILINLLFSNTNRSFLPIKSIFFNAFNKVTNILEPDAPIGCPIDTAPPLTLTFALGIFKVSIAIIGTQEKASFISNKSISSNVNSDCLSTFSIA